MSVRSPICAFLGHVDAGKTSIMDSVRDTFSAYKETGGLTQNIGVTEVPTDRIEEIAGGLLKKFSVQVKTPSIIFVDSPGHEAFVTLRQRGASIADLAILTVDIMEGIQKQTIESIEILKSYKTPFLVALTKIDTIRGFPTVKDASFSDLLSKSGQSYAESLDERLYKLVSDLSNYSFQAERYDRVKDFTKEIAIIPLSSVNNVGVMDLLVMIIGLAQRYIGLEAQGGDSAAVIEEKAVKGMGKIYDAIVYSGTVSVGDRVVSQTMDGLRENKVKGIMRLVPLVESRENFGRYENVKSASAATPVRMILQEPDVLIGTSISVFRSDGEREKLMNEIKSGEEGYNSDEAKGVVVCADSLGSIDAIRKIGKSRGIAIGRTKIGEPSKSDIRVARLNDGVLLCFNVPVQKATESMASQDGVKLISSSSIYNLFERYGEFISDRKRMQLEGELSSLRLPGKIVFLKGNMFRRSSPCVFGVEVLAGEIRPGYRLIREDGKRVGTILDIQEEKSKLDRAVIGQKVAISVDGAVYERNIYDGNIMYTDIEIADIIKFDEISPKLTQDYSSAMGEIRKIKRI